MLNAVKDSHISIHVPRRGSDFCHRLFPLSAADFNPRSPQGERRWKMKRFTLIIDFNPRSPQGERLTLQPPLHILSSTFQSTLPAGGATNVNTKFLHTLSQFQSTLPAGGATFFTVLFTVVPGSISIHAPRRGSDTVK